MKGDKVRIVIDTGGGSREFCMEALKAGRKLEVNTGRSATEVSEVTRYGKIVRTARFMPTRVIALLEEPIDADEDESSTERPVAQAELSLIDGVPQS